LRYLFGYSSKEIKKKELIILLQANVIPTVAERMNLRLGQRNYLEEKRLQFKRRLQRLKSQKRASAGNSHYKKSTYTNPRFYYGVELGPFNDQNEAQKLSKNYKAKGYKVGMLQKNHPSLNLTQYSVVIGAYENQQEAQRLANYFRSQAGIDSKVVKFKNSN
ncbi:MAG: SPOR domain-containing protein, partial [bacterium]